jgi:small subunit ribosomal protein S3Ae
MVKARARTAAKKVKDKWKAKAWYTLLAPAAFNKVTIAETPCDDPEKLVGRIATTTMQDLTGDFKLMHVKLDFQVTAVSGTQAETRFIGHALTSDYVRRIVRRNHSKITVVYDATTKDGALVRVKPIGVTEHRSQSSQQTQLRKIMSDTIQATASELSLGEFAKEMLDGRLSTKLLKAVKPIYPLRKIEINKSEVRTAPTITLEDLAPATEGETPTDGTAGAATETATPEPTPEEGGEEREAVEVAPAKEE